MTLPKIDQPLFDVVIPSSQQKIVFRPFLVKEEKILLIAQQSGNDAEIIRAIKQILGNCIQSEVNIDTLAIFDLEYLFLKLRAKSVNNIIKLSYKDTEDEKIYDFELNLDEIEVNIPEQANSKIEITDDTKSNLHNMSIKQLKDLAKTHKLKTTGTKNELINAISKVL